MLIAFLLWLFRATWALTKVVLQSDWLIQTNQNSYLWIVCQVGEGHVLKQMVQTCGKLHECALNTFNTYCFSVCEPISLKKIWNIYLILFWWTGNLFSWNSGYLTVDYATNKYLEWKAQRIQPKAHLQIGVSVKRGRLVYDLSDCLDSSFKIIHVGAWNMKPDTSFKRVCVVSRHAPVKVLVII